MDQAYTRLQQLYDGNRCLICTQPLSYKHLRSKRYAEGQYHCTECVHRFNIFKSRNPLFRNFCVPCSGSAAFAKYIMYNTVKRTGRSKNGSTQWQTDIEYASLLCFMADQRLCAFCYKPVSGDNLHCIDCDKYYRRTCKKHGLVDNKEIALDDRVTQYTKYYWAHPEKINDLIAKVKSMPKELDIWEDKQVEIDYRRWSAGKIRTNDLARYKGKDLREVYVEIGRDSRCRAETREALKCTSQI